MKRPKTANVDRTKIKNRKQEQKTEKLSLQEAAFIEIKKYNKQILAFVKIIEERREKGVNPVFDIHKDFTLGH